MSYGGGTFTEKNKEIPGVYANFSNIDLFNSDISYGVVVLILPVCYTTTKPSMNYVTVTKNDYQSILVANEFPSGAYGGYTIETISSICLEIFQNATTIHVVPLIIKTTNTGEGTWSYTLEEDTEQKLKTFIEPLSFNTILCISLPYDAADYGTTGANPQVFLNVVNYFYSQTTLRFQWVWGISSAPFIKNIYTQTSSTPLRKWFVLPYTKTAAPFVAGLLSSLSVGKNAAGMVYNGQYTGEAYLPSFAPPTKETQISALNNGYFCFYTLGTTHQLRVLKDITMDHYKETETFTSDYNDRMGQIIRIQIYMYKYFESIFPDQLQGKPNNVAYRSVIKGLILSELRDLESRDVIEDVSENHVTVSAVSGQKDAVDIIIQYKPVSGIDYVYLTFYVN